jgi:nucleotide-binding universal stress UspA family protein
MLRSRRMFDQRSVDRRGAATSSVLLASPSGIVLGQEPSRLTTRVLVAGYDGSSESQAAVVEAGLRAGQTGCVFVVYAYDGPPRFLGSPNYNCRLGRARAVGHRALADLLQGGTWLPQAEYIPELIEGKPAEAIARVAAARHADAIVVGPTEARRLRGKRASVSHELERTVPVPVITIH